MADVRQLRAAQDLQPVALSRRHRRFDAAAVLEKLDRRLQEVDAHLATRDYLTGAFTVADAYLFAVANWSNFLRIPLAPYPHLVAFMARVGARAKVGEALAAEGLAVDARGAPGRRARHASAAWVSRVVSITSSPARKPGFTDGFGNTMRSCSCRTA